MGAAAAGEMGEARDTGGVVAVVDDEVELVAALRRMLERAGYRVHPFTSARAAHAALVEAGLAVDLVLTDVHMPEMTGLELLAALRAERPEVAVIVMTGKATIEVAVDAMRQGAYDFLVKPFEASGTVLASVERARGFQRLARRNRELERRLATSQRFESIIGTSPAIRAVFELVKSVAPTDATVLITGESGTGKELVARAVHEQSARSAGRFVAINCGALTETVLESELFGHVRGAFTGANTSRRGLFEEASGGTLLLDEVGELSPATQVKLLRALQEHEVRPVGSNQARKVDTRIIAATHRDLVAACADGGFRQDLYYRLAVISIEVPSLRQRPGDIPLLARHFVDKHATRMGRQALALTPAALERLRAHDWPGNVRELENVIERALVLGCHEAIDVGDLPPALRAGQARVPAPTPAGPLPPLGEARDGFTRDYLARALEAASGNVAAAARLAGVDRSNFRRMLKRHAVKPER